MELFRFFDMRLWNSRSDILTFRRNGKRFSFVAALVLERCWHLGLSLERGTCPSGMTLGQSRLYFLLYSEFLFHLLCSDLEVAIPILLLCVCVCAFLTSAEVASTEHWVAYSLGCLGYLCRYRDIFAVGLGFCCTSIEVQVIIFLTYLFLTAG